MQGSEEVVSQFPDETGKVFVILDTQTVFTFNDNLYTHLDGVAMNSS